MASRISWCLHELVHSLGENTISKNSLKLTISRYVDLGNAIRDPLISLVGYIWIQPALNLVEDLFLLKAFIHGGWDYTTTYTTTTNQAVVSRWICSPTKKMKMQLTNPKLVKCFISKSFDFIDGIKTLDWSSDITRVLSIPPQVYLCKFIICSCIRASWRLGDNVTNLTYTMRTFIF